MRFVIFKTKATLMSLCQRFCKSQSDTSTCCRGYLVIRHLIESFKYFLFLRVRYSTTIITHIYFIPRIICHKFQINACMGIFDSITYQVHQDLTQLFPINHRYQFLIGYRQHQFNAFQLRRTSELAIYIIHKLLYITAYQIQLQSSVFHLLKVEQLIRNA